MYYIDKIFLVFLVVLGILFLFSIAIYLFVLSRHKGRNIIKKYNFITSPELKALYNDLYSDSSDSQQLALKKIIDKADILYLPLVSYYNLSLKFGELHNKGTIQNTDIYSIDFENKVLTLRLLKDLKKINTYNKENISQLYCKTCFRRPVPYSIGSHKIVLCPNCKSSLHFMRNVTTVVASLDRITPAKNISENDFFVTLWNTSNNTVNNYDWDTLYVTPPKTNMSLNWALNAVVNDVLERKLKGKKIVIDKAVELDPNTLRLLKQTCEVQIGTAASACYFCSDFK